MKKKKVEILSQTEIDSLLTDIANAPAIPIIPIVPINYKYQYELASMQLQLIRTLVIGYDSNKVHKETFLKIIRPLLLID